MITASLPSPDNWRILAALTQRDAILVELVKTLRKHRPAPDCSQRWRVYEVVLASALTAEPHRACALAPEGCGVCSLSCDDDIDQRTMRRWRNVKRYLMEHYRVPLGVDWEAMNTGDVQLAYAPLPLQPLEREL